MSAATSRRRPVRRVRAVTLAGQVRRVHLQVRDPRRGWLLACPARPRSLLVLRDGDRDLVSCRGCANSGLAPSRWLPAAPVGGASR